MKPQALLAIWHDVEPDFVDEYLRWHSFEHIPERLALPGFRRARRFEHVSGPGQRFLCLIEVDRLADFESPEYLSRLNAPTDWTRRLMPRYGRVNRALGRLSVDEGSGITPLIACLRFSLSGGALPGRLIGLAADLRLGFAVAHVQTATVDTAIGAQETEEKRLRRSEDAGGFDHLLVLGGLAEASLCRAADRAEAELAPLATGLEITTYRHSFASGA